MEEDQELQNPFPSPPSHYADYTSHNLHLLSLLKSQLDGQGLTSADPDIDIVKKQHELLPNEKDVPDWPLAQLEKPRVDWILEEGVYNAFGDTWFTKERIPTLAEMGGTQLYPEEPTVDRRPALQSVLRTLLYTYSSFLSSILAPPPPHTSEVPPDWQRLLEWMRVMGQNIMGAANDLRPVQARSNLEAMMNRQLELRREETKAINAKCDALEAKLAELRQHATNIVASAKVQPLEVLLKNIGFCMTTDRSTPKPSKYASAGDVGQSAPMDVGDGVVSTLRDVTEDDVLRWAEELG